MSRDEYVIQREKLIDSTDKWFMSLYERDINGDWLPTAYNTQILCFRCVLRTLFTLDLT